MNDHKKTAGARVVFMLLLFVVIIPFSPLFITRRWGWWEAWVYGVITVLGFAVSRVLASRRHPGLMAERARMLNHDDAERWDRVLAPLVGFGGALIPITAGLEGLIGRLRDFGIASETAALAAVLAGYILGSYALIENRFFSSVVRIQSDRGHQVVSGGPYRWVRHPGYAGAVIVFLATPVLLDSLWSFLPAILLTAVLVVRTFLEDRTLQERLEGYCDYSDRVRYRLLPGVW